MSARMQNQASHRAAAMLDRRAEEIARRIDPERIQPDTRRLPTEAELDAARFACRQLRIAADELRAGFHLDDEVAE